MRNLTSVHVNIPIWLIVETNACRGFMGGGDGDGEGDVPLQLTTVQKARSRCMILVLLQPINGICEPLSRPKGSFTGGTTLLILAIS